MFSTGNESGEHGEGLGGCLQKSRVGKPKQWRVAESGGADCTKMCQGLVYGLQSYDFKGDADAWFSLTGNKKGVKRHSFFGTFPSFADWCGVRGSSEVTVLLRKRGGGQARVYSKALVEENRNERWRQDRVPRRCAGLSGWR